MRSMPLAEAWKRRARVMRAPRNSMRSCSAKISKRHKGGGMGDLREFVAETLELNGAVVEQLAPDGLEVLAPEPVRKVMGWPELARLGFGGERPSGAIPIGLEGDWLDRFGTLLG